MNIYVFEVVVYRIYVTIVNDVSVPYSNCDYYFSLVFVEFCIHFANLNRCLFATYVRSCSCCARSILNIKIYRYILLFFRV